MSVRTSPSSTAVGFLLLAAALAACGVLALRSASSPMPMPHTGADRASRSATITVPPSAWRTLTALDSGGAPPRVDGVEEGAIWPDRDGRLPRADRAGHAVRYREWGVADPDSARAGAERIVTGSDGSAWYSADRCHSFVRMR